MKCVNFNEKLNPLPGSGDNWRTLETKQPMPIPSQFEQILESPIQITTINGEISRIVVEQDEPIWSVNFKKALVSLLKIKTSTGQAISKNLIRNEYNLQTNWRVMEQGVDGECQNNYQVTELSQSMVEELAGELLEAERCAGQRVYEILKVRDISNCSKRAVYQTNQPGRLACATGSCDQVYSRSSTTRYLACGRSEEHMEIQAVVSEGQLQQSLFAFNTENVVTGSKQVLKIVSVGSQMSTLSEIRRPTYLENLYYEYPEEMSSKMITENPSDAILKKYQSSLLAKLSPEALKQNIIKDIEKVARNTLKTGQIEKKTIASHALSIGKVFSYLTTDEVKSVYQDIQESHIEEDIKKFMEQLVFELAVTSGSGPCIMFVKEMIENEEVSALRAGLAIATMPHYIKVPTIKLIDEVFGLLQSPAVSKHLLLRKNAELAFATIVNKACIDLNKQQRYPVYVFGDFCSSETSEITTKYIPFFANKLRSATSSEEKKHLLFVIGTIGHDDIVEVLLPYVKGTAPNSSPLEQRVALYSLTNVAKNQREVLIPLFCTMAHNSSEERSIRMTAFNLLIEMRPSIAYFQKMATFTWFEKDNDFNKYVYSTLKSLSEIPVDAQPSSRNSTITHNSRMAKTVIHLVKPVPTIITNTLNHFTSEWLKGIQAGYQGQVSYEGNSRIKNLYGRLEFYFEQLQFTPIEFSLFSQGHKNLAEKIEQELGQETDNFMSKIHPEWRETIETLGLKPVDDIPYNSGVWLKLFDDVQYFLGVNGENIDSILQSLKQYAMEPRSLKEKFCGTTPYNLVKLNNVAPTEIIVPSDMGLPIFVEVHMSALVSLRGKLNVDCSANLPSIMHEAEHKASVALTGHVGTICPFTEELIAVGVEEQWTVNAPVKVNTEMKMGKLRLSFENIQSTESFGENIDFWSYSVKPYGTIKPSAFTDMTPLGNHRNTKIIKSHSARTFNALQALPSSTGLDMRYTINTETDIRDMKTVLDTMALYKYNPVNTVLFSWTSTALRRNGLPSTRYHEIKMTYNPANSLTKKIDMDLSMASAFKASNFGEPFVVQSQQMDIQLDQHLQELFIDSGRGYRTEVDLKLRGREEKAYKCSAIFGYGKLGSQHKWNLHLVGSSQLQMCIKGHLNLPQTNKSISYKNKIGYGTSCNENNIDMSGLAKVSKTQMKFSEQSESFRKCRAATFKIANLKHLLKTTNAREADAVRKELIMQVEEQLISCKDQLQESSRMDKIKLSIQHSPLPMFAKRFISSLDSTLKPYLMPYITSFKYKNNNGQVVADLSFNKTLGTVDLALSEAHGTTHYNRIRLPERITHLVPIVYTQVEDKISSLLYGSTGSTCRVGDGVVRSFDKVSYAYEIDNCYHLLSSDCGKEYTHAVLARNIGGQKELIVFTRGSKLSVRPVVSGFEINVDGEPVSVESNQAETIKPQGGEFYYTIFR